MAKKKRTYSDVATEITNKYKRRLGDDFTKEDTLARKGLELELNELRDKQEFVKAEQVTHIMPDGTIMPGATHQEAINQGLGSYQNGGKLPKLHTGGGIPHDHNNNVGTEINLALNNAYNNNLDPNFFAEQNNILIDESLNTPNIYKPPTTNTFQSQYYNPALGGTSIVPLAASIAGNLLLNKQANRNINNVDYDRVKPEFVDLSSERIAARSRGSQSRNIIKRTARGIGSNRADYMNRVISGEVAVNKAVGEQTARSLTQEQSTNAQIANQVRAINANIGIREAEANRAEQTYAQTVKDQTIQNIIGDIGSYFGDVRKAKTYNQLYQQLPGTTSLYADSNQKFVDRALFGQRSTIAQDPIKTQKY